MKNIFESRKYFLVFLGTIINMYWHYRLYVDVDFLITVNTTEGLDPAQLVVMITQKREAVNQCLMYQLGILTAYFGVNVARKHKGFVQDYSEPIQEENHLSDGEQ